MLAPKTIPLALRSGTLCTDDLNLPTRVACHGIRIDLLGRPAIAARLAAQHAEFPLVILMIPGACGTAVLP